MDKDKAVGDGGHGEVSMSVEETNKLRASLGLKPLQEKKADDRAEQRRKEEEEAEKKKKTLEIRERLKRAKEKRKEEEFFSRTKPLGEVGSDSDDDDLAAWIQKSRTSKPSNDETRPPDGNTVDKKDDDFMPTDGDGAPKNIAPELVGAKVKHRPDDIEAGETMILTLADQSILTEAGDLNVAEDALENTLKAEDARRKKAYAAAKPKKDEAFDEFGDKKSLLSKYDEEEEEAMMLDPLGGMTLESMKSDPSGQRESLQTALHPVSDYVSSEGPDEEGRQRSSKRRRQKLRKKKETGVLNIVDELEAAKDDAMDWKADHGTRVDRRSHMEQEEQERKKSKEQKTRRFDKALERANLQALRLKVLEEEDEGDEELYEELHKAQFAASQQTTKRFARLAEDAQRRQQKKEPTTENKELVFTDTTEFCRLFSGDNTETRKGTAEEIEIDTETEEQEPTAAKTYKKRHLRPKGSTSEKTDTKMKSREEQEKELGALREPRLGPGLATALGTLRDKGDLKEKFEWVGRTNDMKKSRLVGVDDFYTCGETEDRVEKSIETALTRKDHLGRVLTPKEAFREISYAFHGKGPSQKTIEKRKRKMNEDFLATRSNLDQQSQLNRLKTVQKIQGNAFVLLSGVEKLGQEISSKKKKKPAKKAKTQGSKDAFPSLTPILDKGDSGAPLEGKKKVEAMFGIKPSE